MAAELGELVMTIEADNLRFKNKLKSSEQLVKKSADKMAASLDKVKASSVDTSQGFSILEKAAAATGMTWLSQVKSMGELVFELARVKSSLALSASAYTVEAVAVGKNTAALAANTVARAAQRHAITALHEPWEGLARARAQAGVTARGVRPSRVTIATAAASTTGQLGAMAAYMQRARLAQIGKGLMAAGKATAITAAALAVANLTRKLWGLWRVRTKNAEVLKASQELEKRLSLRMQASRAAVEKQMTTLQRRLQIARKGLTGAAAHEVLYRGTKKDVILDLELQIMRIQERRVTVAQHHARLDQQREQRLQRQLALQKQLTAEEKLRAQVRRQQAAADKAARLVTGSTKDPKEFAAYAMGLVRQLVTQSRQMQRLAKFLDDLVRRAPWYAPYAAQLKEQLGLGPQAMERGGRGMLVSTRGMAGMPTPRLGAGGAGGAITQSTEKKKVSLLGKVAKSTGQMADMMRMGTGMAD